MQDGTEPLFPVLTTERLTLRQLSIADEQQIFTLRTDPRINKYLNRQPCNSIHDAGDFIKRLIAGNALYWAICLKGNHTLVGTVCLFSFSDDNAACEIGYELLTNFQGQGIMQEAVQQVIDYAFNTMGVKKIEAFMHQDNQSSVQLLKKFSFSKAAENDDPALISFYLINSTA